MAGTPRSSFPTARTCASSPDTTVTVTAVQLSQDGNLQSVSLVQKVGRTFTNVQHLVERRELPGRGPLGDAGVRGTQFEVLVRPDNTNLIKVFDGTVKVTGKTTVTLTAGQQLDADANGKLLQPGPIEPEADPFPLAAQCAGRVDGQQPGTVQTSTGDSLATGQTAESDYNSPGGNLTVALCYPGSTMSVTVIDPSGHRDSPGRALAPGQLAISNGPPGLLQGRRSRRSTCRGGEPYSVSFATQRRLPAGQRRHGQRWCARPSATQQISQALAQSGAAGHHPGPGHVVRTRPASTTTPTSAGSRSRGPLIFYAATPNLGAVITQVTVRGINVTTQVVSGLPSASRLDHSIPSDFTVDRVYSCARRPTVSTAI